MIGIDGAKPSSVKKANTPVIDNLAAKGMYNWHARIHNGITYSVPGWTSIMTGVNPDKHGGYDNDDYEERSE